MFREILATQWKSGKTGLGLLTVIAFGLPLLSVQGLGRIPEDAPFGASQATYLFLNWQQWLPAFPSLAGLIGAVFALNAWNWDHKSEHVYALSLPISRGRYALLKGLAGALLVAVPVVAFGTGSILAVSFIEVPDGLNTYPVLFGIRFALASLLIYSAFFALASGTIRTATLVLGGFAAAVVGGEILFSFIAEVMPGFTFSPSELVFGLFMEWPGPFNVISGNWTLIDV